MSTDLHSIPPHRDPHVTDAASAALTALRARSSALRHAAVLTDDGFEVAALPGGLGTEGDRFAGVASALQALGEAAGRELLPPASAPSVVIAGETGQIVLLRATGTTLVVSAVFGGDTTVDEALTSVRLCAEELERRAQ